MLHSLPFYVSKLKFVTTLVLLENTALSLCSLCNIISIATVLMRDSGLVKLTLEPLSLSREYKDSVTGKQ